VSIIYINPYQFATVGPSLWTPADITTALWLDAADESTITESGGGVTQWNDRSGNGRNATQATAASRPARTSGGLNSLNVITFDGSDDWMACAASVFSSRLAYSWFAVARRSTTATVATLFSERIANDGASVQLTAVGTTFILNRATGTSASGLIEQTENISMPTTAQILGSVQSATAGTAYRNGTATATNSATKASLTFRPLLLGGQYDSAAGLGATQQYWPGYIAEFVITQATLSTLDRQKLEGYLAHKWGLAANLPSDHPYKTVAPTV
jgi:hypothetical protein